MKCEAWLAGLLPLPLDSPWPQPLLLPPTHSSTGSPAPRSAGAFGMKQASPFWLFDPAGNFTELLV